MAQYPPNAGNYWVFTEPKTERPNTESINSELTNHPYPGYPVPYAPSPPMPEDSTLNISAHTMRRSSTKCGYCDARYDHYDQLLEHLSNHRIEAIDTILSGHKSRQYKEKPVSEEDRDDFEVVSGSQVPNVSTSELMTRILNQLDDELTRIGQLRKLDDRLDRLEWVTKIFYHLGQVYELLK